MTAWQLSLRVEKRGRGEPQALVFRQDEVVIGRAPGNDIVLHNDNVARRHAMIAVRADGTAVAVDLKSTNGSYLNGERLDGPTPMHPGDKLYVGDFIVMLAREPERSG